LGVVTSDAPPYLQSIASLDSDARQIILALLAHPIVVRLRHVKELGYTSRVFTSATHTRWDHTLWTVDAMCRLLDVAPSLPRDIKLHLLAAAVVQDVGHSPFSNSLASVFGGAWVENAQSYLLPADKGRAVLILEHVEKHEQLFSRLGLTFEVMVQLVAGHFPWARHGWVQKFVEGVLDADRLAYVEQDSNLALQLRVGPTVERVAKSVKAETPGEITIIDKAGVEDVHEFVGIRGRLYTEVYHDLRKLAWDRIMRDALTYVWGQTSDPEVARLRKPETVQEFLHWTDGHVDRALERPTRDSLLAELQSALKSGEMMVGEVESLGGRSLSFGQLDEILEAFEIDTFPKALLWMIRSNELEAVRIYEPSSILVKDRGGYQPLEKVEPSLASLAQSFRRSPMIIVRSGLIRELLRSLNDRGLTLGQLQLVAMPQ
jgi:HD superfamily phosphohydrolase